MERREFVVGGGVGVVTALSGCLAEVGSEGKDPDTDPENSNASPDVEPLGQQFPEPSVTDVRYPEPQVVSTDSENQGDDVYEFSITLENTGMSGDLNIELVYLIDQERSVWSSWAEEAGSHQLYFSAGERRTETFTAELPSLYSAYGFRLTPSEAEVDVRNDGAMGEVVVDLLQTGGADEKIVERKTVDVPKETTQTVGFTVELSLSEDQAVDDLVLDAEAARPVFAGGSSDE